MSNTTTVATSIRPSRTTVQVLRGGFIISGEAACKWATTIRGPGPFDLTPTERHSGNIVVILDGAIRAVGGAGCGFQGAFAGDKYIACSHRRRRAFDIELHEENLKSGVVPPSYQFAPNEATARVEKLLDDAGIEHGEFQTVFAETYRRW
ncbi:hypothetical protein PLICRDRAFT_31818 [Plicaturopsis crispa FD-325 SS-3]|nr:hypothetical protein PLICRDRAFT_31818 [Plicaturopsis crispa FD-325 SS-3]